MKYLLILCLISCSTIKTKFFHRELPNHTICPYGLAVNKKILILYNNSGGGHVSAAKSLGKLLGNEYCLKFMDFSEEIIAKSWGITSPDHFYNQQLKEQNYKYLNRMSKKLLPGLLYFSGWKMALELKNKIKEDKPDLIISTIPFINNIVLDVANDNKIPLIVLTMDQKLDNWVVNLNKNLVLKSDVYFTVGLSPEPLIAQLNNAGIPQQQIYNTGFPIRQSFRNSHDKLLSRKKFGLLNDKLVVMVMLGGSSSDLMYHIVQELKKITDKEMHLILVAGRNKDLEKKLRAIELPQNISKSIFGFVEEIDELMSASDILISKPGPQSVYEAVHIKIPLIIDMTKGALIHEEATANYVINQNIGKAFYNLKELNNIVLDMAQRDRYLNFKKNFDKIPLKNFDEEFSKIVKNILKK